MTGLPKPHESWCQRTAQVHSICYARINSVVVATDVMATVELSKATGVPALVVLVVDRGPHRSLLPMGVEVAHQVGQALDEAVALVVAG